MSALPKPIAGFFRLKNPGDDEALPRLFSDDATVIDDVRGWKEEDGEWIVDRVLMGNFKASPARFEYGMALDGDRIAQLRVEFRGSQKL